MAAVINKQTSKQASKQCVLVRHKIQTYSTTEIDSHSSILTNCTCQTNLEPFMIDMRRLQNGLEEIKLVQAKQTDRDINDALYTVDKVRLGQQHWALARIWVGHVRLPCHSFDIERWHDCSVLAD
jgi:hypothetical protein